MAAAVRGHSRLADQDAPTVGGDSIDLVDGP